jgi:hypothetical protein
VSRRRHQFDFARGLKMPGGFPLGLEFANVQAFSIPNTSFSDFSCQASPTANTKGSWSLIGTTSADCCWLDIDIIAAVTDTSTANYAMAVDLALGSSQQIIINNLIVTYGGEIQNGGARYSFPFTIPAGTPIYARCAQSYTSSPDGDTIYLSVRTSDGGFAQMAGAAGVDTIGFNPSTGFGAAIDPGATVNTKGAWTQIGTALHDYMGFSVGLDTQGNSNSSPTFALGLMDIALGSADQIILPNLLFINILVPESLTLEPDTWGFIPIPIPKGTAIYGRGESTNNTAGTRTWGCTLYGAYK